MPTEKHKFRRPTQKEAKEERMKSNTKPTYQIGNLIVFKHEIYKGAETLLRQEHIITAVGYPDKHGNVLWKYNTTNAKELEEKDIFYNLD